MKTVKDILTIILSAYLLLAIGGFSIFHHLCNCTAESKLSTSLLVEQSCCTANSDVPMNCHNDLSTSTCGAGGQEGCSCETEIEVLETDETLTIEFKRISNIQISLLVTILFANYTVANESNTKFPSLAEVIPPPKSGKSMVILHQCLKIPHRT